MDKGVSMSELSVYIGTSMFNRSKHKITENGYAIISMYVDHSSVFACKDVEGVNGVCEVFSMNNTKLFR